MYVVVSIFMRADRLTTAVHIRFETQVIMTLAFATLSLCFEAQIRICLGRKGNQMNIDTTTFMAYPKSDFWHSNHLSYSMSIILSFATVIIDQTAF